VYEAAAATKLALTAAHVERLEAAARRLPGVVEHSLTETTYP
jgi:thioredoxin-like negative regulator of GroEL